MRTENIYSVYVHKNLKNEKYYVGCTKQNPKERWNYGCGYQRHPKMWKDIQESNWNTDWVHGILGKFTDKNEALKYEAFLIAMLDSVRNGYNSSSYGNSHFKHSEESKKKVSEAMTGEKNPMYGKHLSEETKNKMSASKFGNHYAPTKSVLQYSKDGKLIAEYPSLHEASRQTGCNKGHICDCCKGTRKSAGGYIWKYKEGI